MTKLVQILTFYPEYLRYFYEKFPFVANLDYESQLDYLIKDGFGCSVLFAPYLKNYGFEIQIIIANNYYLQKAWTNENGLSSYFQPIPTFNFEGIDFKLVQNQILLAKPDILFFADTINFHKPFFNNLNFIPKLLVGWRSASIPKNIDWSNYDLIISNNPDNLVQAKKIGAKNIELFHPAAPSFFYTILKDEAKIYDFTFVGQISREHKKRLHTLNSLVKKFHSFYEEYDSINFSFFLSGVPTFELPTGIAIFNKGPVYGLDMFKILKQSKICLNVDVDFGKGGNFRTIEITSVGSFLLTNENVETSKYYLPGKEIETFKDEEELFEKIIYYLKNEHKREEIAQNGYLKFLEKHSMEVRAKEFVELIERHLRKKFNNLNQTADLVSSPYVEGFKTKDTSTKSIVTSPFTGEMARLLNTFQVSEIIKGYQLLLGVDVSKIFINCEKVELYECPTTKIQFFHPNTIFGDENFYSQLSKLPWYYMDFKWEHQRAFQMIKEKSDVLEIGCGKGEFLKKLLQKNCNVFGLEINPESQKNLIDANLKIYNQTIEEHSNQTKFKYDYICLFQTLEHISNVKEFILNALKILKENGYLLISVPNQNSFISLDKFNLLDLPPHHMTRWTELSLKNLEIILPIKCVDIQTEPLQAYHFEWFKNLITKTFNSSEIIEYLIKFANESPNFIKGHTILGIFQKL
ncbi:MAG: methyltransferase domain-containing protein [Ignavibacteria bacterium]|nr:methyltransferase domain-containing protein [Ignavibacteria bacterium]